MTDPTTFLQQTYQELARLRQQAGQYSRPEAVPPALLRRIEALEDAVYLTRQYLDGGLSEREWRRALQPLLAEPPGPVEPPPDPLPPPEVPPAMPDYNLTNIRTLLTKGFSDTELRNFCFDTPEFREVYDQLSYGTGKEQLVSLMMDHADQNLLFEPLLAWAKAQNPARYQQHQPYVSDTPRPEPRPARPRPSGGDPAQGGPIIIVHGDVNMGDQFNMSGDFRGAILNIKSTLNNVSQSVGAMPHGDEQLKAELQRLIAELSAALEKAPPEQAETAQEVAQSAELLVKTAGEEKPSKTLLKISGESLRQAAQNLAAVMPLVLPIATQIVETVRKLVG